MKKLKTLLGVSILVMLFTSCCDIFGIKYKADTSGGIRPKKDRFFKYKEISEDESQTYGLDFTHVYMRIHGSLNFNGERVDSSAFSFYRFFPTGEVLISRSNHYLPPQKEIDNIQQGLAGRYKVKGDLLKIEYISDHDCGQRVLEQARIEAGFIRVYQQSPTTFYGWIPKHAITDTFSIYNKIGLSNSDPDW